ncbi:unnamed protein product, partial [Gulo gulo]
CLRGDTVGAREPQDRVPPRGVLSSPALPLLAACMSAGGDCPISPRQAFTQAGERRTKSNGEIRSGFIHHKKGWDKGQCVSNLP